MGENFKLKWNDHHSIFFSTAEALCAGDHLTDVTLSCGKREFSAHKLVLSICSTYFNELFKPNKNISRPATGAAIVYLKDVNPHHMELLLNFMYRGEINVEEDELMGLLNTARGLAIRGLSDSEEDNQDTQTAQSATSSKPQKAVKRVKTPTDSPNVVQPSTSANSGSPAAKKIKQESHHLNPISTEANFEEYDDDGTGQAEDMPSEYVEGEENDYSIDNSGAQGMIYEEGDLPPPEVGVDYFSKRIGLVFFA